MKHPITPEMIRRFVAIIAKTRSGKTFAIKGAIEELLDAGEQVVVLDPTSAYYGLRLDRDGKTPAHPNLLIVGGDYGDIPIVPTVEACRLGQYAMKYALRLIANHGLSPSRVVSMTFNRKSDGLKVQFAPRLELCSYVKVPA